MTMNAIATRDIIQMKSDDIHALVLPLFHSFGQTCQMNAGFSIGNTIVLIPRFTPEAVLGAFQDEKVSILIGVPHDSHGEEVKAFIVLKEGLNATADELIAWSKEQMAVYKYPRIVEMRTALPMPATEKILKKDLKAETAA